LEDLLLAHASIISTTFLEEKFGVALQFWHMP
jgi:hypothetical protein